MSYNSAYREDTQNTMSNVILEYTRNVANEIRETFLSGPTPPPSPVVDPNLLFDANFNDSSLAVDYSKDDSALLVFESNNMNNIVPGDGFVSSTGHSTHIKLTSGLPAYLKHTGDQSWVVNFRINAPLSTTRFIIHTAPVGPDRATTFEIRTGMFMFLYNNNFQATLFKGPADTLVGLSATIGAVDLDLQINSAVFTYERLNHKLSLYFNGVFLSSILAPAGFIDDVVDWSTADNMYVNQSNRFSIANLTHYHKISVYDKILTPEEIEDIYNASPPVVSINKKLIVLPADFASVDVVLAGVLQMSTMFQINISAINNAAHFMNIRGPPTNPNGRMSTIVVLGQTATTISIQIAMDYHYRGYRSARFDINKNQMITLGYTIEADGALRVFYNGTLVGDGGSFYQESLPLVPFERVVTEFNIVSNMSCLLGDVAYYKVQKSDAFMQNVDNYYINQEDTELIFGWKQGTLIDVVNSIPISIEVPPPVFVK